jgi:hypothetical protein
MKYRHFLKDPQAQDRFAIVVVLKPASHHQPILYTRALHFNSAARCEASLH